MVRLNHHAKFLFLAIVYAIIVQREARLLTDLERDYIRDVLKSRGGNRSVTARLLGMARSTLQEKLKKYGIEETP